MRTLPFTALALLATVLAGCSDGDAPSTTSPGVDTNPADVEVDPESDLGAISGIVVDDAIYPLDGVDVAFTDGSRNTTTRDGVFKFEDVKPGAYFLNASHSGYAGAPTSVQVEAGKVAYVRILLSRMPGLEPYHYTVQKQGFIQASPAAGGAIADAAMEGFTGDNPLCQECIFTVETGGQDVQTFVIEAFWETTLPPATAEDLFLSIINENFTTAKPGYGESIKAPYLKHLAPSDPAFNDGANSTWFRFQVSGSLYQPNYNQQYDLFVTVFVNAPAPEGWSLAAGGL